MQFEACYLSQGMNSGIGATGALGQGLFASNALDGLLEFALDGDFTGLDLPAVEISAVIGQDEFPVLELRDGFGRIGHWKGRSYQGIRRGRTRKRKTHWDILNFL